MSVDVRTVADSRVVAEQGVVLNQYVGPLNWEHYRIPASGLSNTQITFANLVTLGTNRIYDSNFCIEYTIQVQYPSTLASITADGMREMLKMNPFPLHWVTDQLRININGAACMVRPQENLPQRMMYWRQRILDKTCSYCPHTKCPTVIEGPVFGTYEQIETNFQDKYSKTIARDVGTALPCVDFQWDNTNKIATITIREPVLCPPFNQRLDHVYQSPLFNITSIDLVYQLNNLKHMLAPFYAVQLPALTPAPMAGQTDMLPSSVQSINITSANLCFNVASMPPGMTVPPSLQLPYYDNVCYVTAGGLTTASTGEVNMTSGVYTLAQVPTAIYIFVSENQLFRSGSDPCATAAGSVTTEDLNWSLSPIRNINITMGNNTQLLNTTTEFDRYQMALVNGLEGVSWEEFTRTAIPRYNAPTSAIDYAPVYNKCILRLIPGVDLLIPDKRLVGGTDAGQLVFQVQVTVDVTDIPAPCKPYLSLWIMFEYCGILTIEPVHAAIDMVPLKSQPPIGGIDVITNSEADNATGGGEGTNPTGAGILDWIKGAYKGVKSLWNSSLGKTVRGAADKFLDGGLFMPTSKRGVRSATGGDIIGGSIMGGGDFYT